MYHTTSLVFTFKVGGQSSTQRKVNFDEAEDVVAPPSLLTGKMYEPPASVVAAVCTDVEQMKKLHISIAALMEHHNTALTMILTTNNVTNAKLCAGKHQS